MFGLNYKLSQREEEGRQVIAGVIGAGQQGRGMIASMVSMDGIRPAVLADIVVENAVRAYEAAGLSKGDFIVTDQLSEAEDAIRQGKYVATGDLSLVTNADQVEAVVDATGVPEAGAHIAVDTIQNGKHIIMMNVETDITVGSYLKSLADQQGVVYTGSAGDEPGAVKEFYDFARAMGFEVRVLGKGQNHAINRASTPESVAEEAERLRLNPRMLCEFKDGSKTMVEMTAMANSTGLTCDIRGSHGPTCGVDGLKDAFLTKAEGGILDGYGVVEYVNGVAPGVFAIISHPNGEVRADMDYFRMGKGPNYALYRPFHLCCLETPLSVAMAVIDHMPTIAPVGKPCCDTVAVAKRDLKAGEALDCIGGHTVYGMIEKYDVSRQIGALPLGLVSKNIKLSRDVGKGEVITYDSIIPDESSYVYQLRKLQDAMY